MTRAYEIHPELEYQATVPIERSYGPHASSVIQVRSVSRVAFCVPGALRLLRFQKDHMVLALLDRIGWRNLSLEIARSHHFAVRASNESKCAATRRKLCAAVAKEPLINLRIMAHCAFDSRATVWTGS